MPDVVPAAYLARIRLKRFVGALLFQVIRRQSCALHSRMANLVSARSAPRTPMNYERAFVITKNSEAHCPLPQPSAIAHCLRFGPA